MAALNRPTQASYEVHESIKVDTRDNEDHTFCGMMFPIKAKSVVPIQHLVIHSVAVRGALGPMTVWVSNDDMHANRNGSYNFQLSPRYWTKVYEAKLSPSNRQYKELSLHHPIVIRPGQLRAIYIHSELEGDDAIVYDNSSAGARRQFRYEDKFLYVASGRAHLSNTVFGTTPIWGWGNAWRDHREFVGQIQYGVVYKLWHPHWHAQYGPKFGSVTESLLAQQRRPASVWAILPDECLYYILNMCRWDWFEDTVEGLQKKKRLKKRRVRMQAEERARQAQKRRLEQQQQAATEKRSCCEHLLARDQDPEETYYDAETDDVAAMEEDEADDDDGQEGAGVAVAVAAAHGDDDDDNDSSADDASAAGSDESEWERANGYRADMNAFSCRDVSSDDETDEEPTPDWLSRNIRRIHILRALAGSERDDVTDVRMR